jgi:hypothetical protein
MSVRPILCVSLTNSMCLSDQYYCVSQTRAMCQSDHVYESVRLGKLGLYALVVSIQGRFQQFSRKILTVFQADFNSFSGRLTQFCPKSNKAVRFLNIRKQLVCMFT